MLPILRVGSEEPPPAEIRAAVDVVDPARTPPLRLVVTSAPDNALMVELDAISDAPAGWTWLDLDAEVIARLEPASSRRAVTSWARERAEGWSPLRPSGPTPAGSPTPPDIAPTDGSEPVDLTDEDAVRRWVDAAAETHGRIDVLYANAGATRFGPLEEITRDDGDFNLRHELDVVFFPVKHAWPHLKRAQAPAVVLIGSTADITGSTTNARVAHTVTKGGVVALTKQLATEGAPHAIRVNCVSPGMIETPATRGDLLAEDHPMRTTARAIPLGRVGRPEEVRGARGSWPATRRRTSPAPTWSSTAAGRQCCRRDGKVTARMTARVTARGRKADRAWPVRTRRLTRGDQIVVITCGRCVLVLGSTYSTAGSPQGARGTLPGGPDFRPGQPGWTGVV